MANKDQFLTTAEFSSKTGMPVSTVTKLIRAGKIEAEKKSGKWLISPDQLNASALKDSGKPGKRAKDQKTVRQTKRKTTAKKAAQPKKDRSAKTKAIRGKAYSMAEFVAMTYLTEFGVREWLKQGLITGQQGSGGEWEIDAANLKASHVKRLVRE